MSVSRMELPKETLEKLDENDRTVVLVFGHVINELNILIKTAMAAVDTIKGRPHHDVPEISQAFFFVTLLAGKTSEAWEAYKRLVQKRSQNGRRYRAIIDSNSTSSDAHKKLAQMMNSGKLTAVRNVHAFHYDNRAIQDHFQKTPLEENWAIYVGTVAANTFHAASDAVARNALLQTFNADNQEAEINQEVAIKKFGDHVIPASGLMTDILDVLVTGLILTVIPEPKFINAVVDENELPAIRSVRLPYFLATPSSEHIEQGTKDSQDD